MGARSGVGKDELSHTIDANLKGAVIQEISSKFDDMRWYVKLFQFFDEDVVTYTVVGVDNIQKNGHDLAVRAHCDVLQVC